MKIKLLLCLIFCLSLLYGQVTSQEVATGNLIPVSVSITGDVKNPGVYTLTTLNRVSEALAMAENLTTALTNLQPKAMLPEITELPKARLPLTADTTSTVVYGQRTITLVRDGIRQNLDLLRFFRLGDLEQNPYLKDGDVIIINPVQTVVTIEGSVRKPGDYEFRAGDTIKDLLQLALGTLEDADLQKVMLYRYRPGWTEFDKQILDLSGFPHGSAQALSLPLQAGDRILIPTNAEFRKVLKVLVTGKVKMPGLYYADEQTSLYDLLVMCGGPTREADLPNAFVYNKIVSENFDPDFERLSKYSYLQMTWLEYSYLRTKTRQLKGKYSVSVDQCWKTQGKEMNLLLRDGDELYIPELLNGVWVAGQVRQPGLVTWQKDLGWKDYLELAGGFANNRKAQGTRIIRVHSGNWVKPSKDAKINPGDIIFVPDKEERYLWTDIKDVILVASQLMTILIAVRTFSN